MTKQQEALKKTNQSNEQKTTETPAQNGLHVLPVALDVYCQITGLISSVTCKPQ